MSGEQCAKKMAETFKDIKDSEYCERGEDLVLDVCNTWLPSYTAS